MFMESPDAQMSSFSHEAEKQTVTTKDYDMHQTPTP